MSIAYEPVTRVCTSHGRGKKKQHHRLMRQDQAQFLGVGILVGPSMPHSAPLLQPTEIESRTEYSVQPWKGPSLSPNTILPLDILVAKIQTDVPLNAVVNLYHCIGLVDILKPLENVL